MLVTPWSQMQRPLLPVVCWYAAGVALASQVEVSLFALFVVAFLAGLTTLLWGHRIRVLLMAFLFFTGWVNLGWREARISPHDLRTLVGEREEIVTVRGRIGGVTSPRVAEREGAESWHTLVMLEVDALRVKNGAWQPAAGTVQTSTRGNALTNLFAGQPVEVTGVLAPPPGATAQGLFDYRAYLRWLGVYYLLRVDSAQHWQSLGPLLPPPWTEGFRRWAQGTLARGLPAIDEPLKLQWAMVLGWKTALTDEVSEPFMRSGTMHIFAISGLHIALISTILLALFRLVNLPRSACGAVVIPLIWFYTAATEWQASAIRSTVMMTVIIAGWSLRRPSNLVNSLAGAAFIILLWDPAQLFQAGFQLSFAAVLSIAVVMPPLEALRHRWLQPDPLLLEELRPRWQRWLWGAANRLAQGLSTSLAATVGTAPLIAWYFHLFSPVSLLANLVVVPLSGWALMCGLGGVICGGWWTWGAECFNHAGWFFMACMAGVSQWLAGLPGAYYYVRAPGFSFLALYYATLAAWLTGAFRSERWRWVWAGLSLLAIAWLADCWHEHRAIRLTVLPLRGGDATWLDHPGWKGDWLIDCGDALSSERVTVPFLRAQGVRRLPHLLLTHGDVRHVGGATNLFVNFSVQALHVSPARFSAPAYRAAISAWTNHHRTVSTVAAGSRYGPWEVLHPTPHDRAPRADDKPLVLRGLFHGCRVLLCSDLSLAGQNALLRRGSDLRADIVVAGLPTGGEPLHNALLEAIQPSVIIIADDQQPAAARARPDLQARLGRRGVPVLFIHEAQAVTIEFRHGRAKVSTMNRSESLVIRKPPRTRTRP